MLAKSITFMPPNLRSEMNDNIHNDWLPITLPNDMTELKNLLYMEKKYGCRENVKAIEKAINKLNGAKK